MTPGQKGNKRKNDKNKDSGEALLYYKRETSSETPINRTPGLPSLPTLVVDAEDVDDVDDELDVPLRAMASAWKAEKLRAEVSSELIAL